jgi:hypothetical protein
MNAPVIITVTDSKWHFIAETIVDYTEVDEVIAQIKESCEKKRWNYTLSVPSSQEFFVNRIKDLSNVA